MTTLIDRTCQQCGCRFSVLAWRIKEEGRGQFCSRRCHVQFRVGKPRVTLKTLVSIPKKILQYLYVDKELSISEVAKISGYRPTSIYKWLQRYGLARSLSESNTLRYQKEEARQETSEAMMKWWRNAPEETFNERVRKSARRPNNYEKALGALLQELFPNQWQYTGDGKLIIDHKNPDFVNINGRKQLIELWGEYWHKHDDPEGRISHFGRWGYQTLIIWASELKKPELLKQKLLKEFG